MSKTDRDREDYYERRSRRENRKIVWLVGVFILCVLAVRALVELFSR
jgi:hypothetical protein